jgi:hypothetical protein
MAQVTNYIDIGQVMSSAFGARRQQQAIEAGRLEMERAQEQRAKQRTDEQRQRQFDLAVRNVPEDQRLKILYKIDPERAREYELGQYQMQNVRAGAAQAKQQQQVSQLTQLIRIGEYAKQNPDTRPFIFEQLGQTNPDVMQQINQRLSGGESEDKILGDMLGQATAQLQQFIEPEAPEYLDPQDPEGMFLASLLPPGAPPTKRSALELLQNDPEARAKYDRLKEGRARAGAPNISVGGGVGLTPAQKSARQEEIFDSSVKIDALDDIEKSIEAMGGYDAYADAGAAVTDFLAGAATRLPGVRGLVGQDARKALATRAAVSAKIASFTNKAINDIAGANVPEAEMRRVIRGLPSPDDPPDVLGAKIQGTKENLKRLREMGYSVLTEGVKPGTGKSGGPSLDEIRAERERRRRGGGG